MTGKHQIRFIYMSNALTFQCMVQTTQRRTNLAWKAKKKKKARTEKKKIRYVSHPHTGGKQSTMDHHHKLTI
jgi:hypothetical protein